MLGRRIELIDCPARRIHRRPHHGLHQVPVRRRRARVHDHKQPIHGIECCCVDCYDKNIWSYKAGKAPLPSGVSAVHGVGSPAALYYYPNKFEVTGKEKLAVNKVRAGGASTNMVTTCCSTLLCVDNPAYQANGARRTPALFTPCPVPRG